eukprot:403352846
MREIQDFMERELPVIIKKDIVMHNKPLTQIDDTDLDNSKLSQNEFKKYKEYQENKDIQVKKQKLFDTINTAQSNTLDKKTQFLAAKERIFNTQYSSFDKYSSKINVNEMVSELMQNSINPQQQGDILSKIKNRVKLQQQVKQISVKYNTGSQTERVFQQKRGKSNKVKDLSSMQSDLIMNCVSREKRDQVLSPKMKVPPLGQYRPNLDLIQQHYSASNLKFQDPHQRNAGRDVFGVHSILVRDDQSQLLGNNNYHKIKMEHAQNDNTFEDQSLIEDLDLHKANNTNKEDNENFNLQQTHNLNKSKSSMSLNKSRCMNLIQNQLKFQQDQLNNTKSTFLNQTGYVQFGLRPVRELNTPPKDSSTGKYIDREKFFPAIYSKYKKLTRDLDIKNFSQRDELWKQSDCQHTLNLEPNFSLTKQKSHACIIRGTPKSSRNSEFRMGTGKTDISRKTNSTVSNAKFDLTKIIPPLVNERDPTYIRDQDSKMLLSLIKERYTQSYNLQ